VEYDEQGSNTTSNSYIDAIALVKLCLHQIYVLSLFTVSQLLKSHCTFYLSRKCSMGVESGAGCVPILLETFKTVLLSDSAANSVACARPQEREVSLKWFLPAVHVIPPVLCCYNGNNSIAINYRTSLWSLFFQLSTYVRISWSAL
jgi:hypothetical protein